MVLARWLNRICGDRRVYWVRASYLSSAMFVSGYFRFSNAGTSRSTKTEVAGTQFLGLRGKTSSSAAPLTKSACKYRSKLRNRLVEVNYRFPIPREFQKQLKEKKMRSKRRTVRLSVKTIEVLDDWAPNAEFRNLLWQDAGDANLQWILATVFRNFKIGS